MLITVFGCLFVCIDDCDKQNDNPIKTKRGRLSPSGSFFLHISEINRTNNLKFLDFVPNLVIIHLPKFESVITCILKVISN